MANVEFSAKFEGLNMTGKNKITLLLPENLDDKTLGRLVKLKGKTKGENIYVSFEDPQQEMDLDEEERPERRVMTFTTDQSGVVDVVQNEEPASEEGQQVDIEEAIEQVEQSEPEPGQEGGDAQDQEPKNEPEQESKEIGSDEIENYILAEKPKFDDEHDFPELLRRRREDNDTWMDIAKELGITSGQLQGRWQLYKKKVKKKMQEGGAA